MSSTIHSSEIESMADGPGRTFVMSMDPDVLLDDGDSSSFSVIEDDSSEEESDDDVEEDEGEEWSLSKSQVSGTMAREHTSGGGGFSLRGSSHGGGLSFSKMGSTVTTATPTDQVATAAEGGTKIVNRFRYFVVISLIAVGLVISLTTQGVFSYQKSQTHQDTYDWISSSVLKQLQDRLGAIETNVQWLAETIHSSSIDNQDTFATVADHLRSTVFLESIFVAFGETTETNTSRTFSSPELTEFGAAEESVLQAAIPLFEANKTNQTVLRGIHSSMNEQGYHSYITPIANSSGLVLSEFAWGTVLERLVPESLDGIIAVISDTCGTTVAYDVSSSQQTQLIHDANERIIPETRLTATLVSFNSTGRFCGYSVSLYASDLILVTDSSSTLRGAMWTIGSMSFLTILVFYIYDRIVGRRHLAILHAAARSNAIISSLFPTNFRDRLFEEADNEADAETKESRKSDLNGSSSDPLVAAVQGLNDDDDAVAYKGKPIADLFPETTILFADIAGFTAWSSVREPSQVFILLETLYHAFDTIAKQRGVFKVETVGDCYVAATGLPEPRADHAVVMCRFAYECMNRTNVLTKRLEVLLGPDTADLSMRMGIHSGPVTAGVLRGERSRFQLFGDTMNTAARMEHNGIRDKIQLSQETADLLIEAGKSNWLARREDLINAKGKGEMQTYFLDMSKRSSSQVDTSSNPDSMEESVAPSSSPSGDDFPSEMLDSKTRRLVGWCVDVLMKLLKQIEARRRATAAREIELPNEAMFHVSNREKHGVLDEIKEIIALPKFQEINQEDSDSITLRPEVAQELQSFVANIARMYKPNYFHNFEHASHVTMSVVKLLARIVAPKECASGDLSSLHDHTYGITSDPLTQFACVLSALIHDADHKGVSNMQLVKECDPVATKYNNKSVLEQNSIDLAWDLLMTDEYKNLRRTIYQTDAELLRFRQLLVNSVMATDISDKELKTLRNLRWERAFKETTEEVFNERDTINRKATIVIEHLIQASDVSHTMQHWHVYRKWNERFFMECYQAYKDGRAETDPSVGWYKGEIGFFDFYIIPLARKLKECGVFGVSSAEYLNYAIHNRQEWEARGKEVVDEMLEKVK